MRLMLATSLMIAPVLMHAQNPASQQLVAVNAPVVRAVADRPAADAPRRISSGVIAPRLLKSVSVVNTGRTLAGSQHVEVSFTVSKGGVPTDIKVVSSVDPQFAQSIVDSVAQYRYEPGTLDGAPAAVPVELDLTVVSGSR